MRDAVVGGVDSRAMSDGVSTVHDARSEAPRLGDSGVDRDSSMASADQGTVTGAACARLPAATGKTISVVPAQAGELPRIVREAASGTTILLADGLYTMTGAESSRRLTFSTPGVALRSTSGDASKVVIDGDYKTHEVLFINASDVTIADLTIKRAVDHLIHVTGSSSGAARVRLHNLRLIDSGEQFVKVNSDGKGHYADGGRLECSRLTMTAAGRPQIETNPGGCYTGGIDAHGARDWKVRLNRFEGIHCRNGSLAEHAVHFWSGSRGTLVERNVIVDCARGIGFGLVESGVSRAYSDDPYPGAGYLGHVDGLIRNNVIHAAGAAAAYFDTGIELDQARGARVLHNTVASKPTYSSIDARFSNTLVTIRNNLTQRITSRDGAKWTEDHNLQGAAAGLFVDADAADYRLRNNASAAIDKGAAQADSGLDLDGHPHDIGAPDLGAYEYQR